MSIHPSLRGADSLKGERSVLSRAERIAKLANDGKFEPETDSAWGLPKVRTKFRVKKPKKAAAEGEDAEAAEGAEAENADDASSDA